jgi:hypothetical protein
VSGVEVRPERDSDIAVGELRDGQFLENADKFLENAIKAADYDQSRGVNMNI